MALTQGKAKKRRRGNPDPFLRLQREEKFLERQELGRRLRKFFKEQFKRSNPGKKNPFERIR